ncbi:MAG: aggregation-promoting factor C-terminal-like domain-containing protein [Dermatophilaceae bacterium]
MAFAAVAGVTAAGYASAAKPQVFAASFTVSPAAVAQATELSDNQIDTNAALSQARRAGVQRLSALTQQQKVAAAAEAAALSRAREAAAERAARERDRQGILARAQSDPRAVGRLLVADRGWSDTQFGCLDSLWAKESGWRWDSNNSSSGAYGIPQALPGSKMASFGSDWATNPVTQITWGLQYISDRYGTPCGAWAQSRATNWY